MANSESILIVDDDPSIVNLLRENLDSLGYRTLVGYDGQAALVIAKSALPKLIILDVNMPMLNGLKVHEFLRANANTSRIPILFLTGEVSSRLEPTMSTASRVAHVKKPIDLDDLNSVVKHLLDEFPT